MVLKIYEYQGSTYQFTEGKQPQGAVEWTAKRAAQGESAPAKAKAVPANKRGPRPANK